MKIVFFSSYPYFSGSHKIALQLANGVKRAGHHVIISAPERNPYIENAEKMGFETLVLQAPESMLAIGNKIFQKSTLEKIRRIFTDVLPYNLKVYRKMRHIKPDLVYFAQERGLLQTGLGMWLARMKMLLHIQGGLSDRGKWLHRISFCLTKNVICVSKAVRGDIYEYLQKDKVDAIPILYNGLPDIAFNPHFSDGNKTTLLFAGNVVPQRGVHTIIEALNLLPDNIRSTVELNAAGWLLEDEYTEYLKQMISKYNLGNQVHLLGYCQNMADLMETADIILCPTIHNGAITMHGKTQRLLCKEGFGLTALEAMRIEKPVIASNVYGLAEVVADQKTGYLIPCDKPKEMAEKLEMLINNPNLRQQFGRAGRERYLRMFTQDKMIRDFIQHLDKIS